MSRTGTARWYRVRDKARAQAIERGQFNCPTCGVALDFEYSQRPNSAEVDHIVPASLGGTDTLDNVRITCRWCNQRRGNGTRRITPTVPTNLEPETKTAW